MSVILTQISQESFKELVGVSYEKANCWVPTKEFYRIVFGIELKHYYCDAPETREDIQKLIYSNKGDFERVDGSPEFGDIILIKMFGIESHIAVYIGNGKMLHTAKRTGSLIDRLGKWDKLVVGYFRHRGKAGC